MYVLVMYEVSKLFFLLVRIATRVGTAIANNKKGTDEGNERWRGSRHEHIYNFAFPFTYEFK